MRASAIVPFALLLVGGGLITEALLQGSASVALVVVFPVVFGGSAEFFGGVVLLFFGFVTLPLAFDLSLASPEEAGSRPGRATTPPAEVGGLILIGPVPIFFGGWREVSRRTRLLVAAIGGAVLVGLVLLVLVVR